MQAAQPGAGAPLLDPLYSSVLFYHSNSNDSELYSGGFRFECWLPRRLCSLRDFLQFMKVQTIYWLKLNQNHFISPSPEVKSGRGVRLIPHPLLVPWSRKGRAIPLRPLWAVRPVQSLSACARVHFTLPFLRVVTSALCRQHPLIEVEKSVKYLNTDKMRVKALQTTTSE